MKIRVIVLALMVAIASISCTNKNLTTQQDSKEYDIVIYGGTSAGIAETQYDFEYQ